MIDPKIVKRLMLDLESLIRDLEDDKSVAIEEFLSDRRTYRTVERTLEMAAQCCIDIASHIISDDALREPEDYADIFACLSEGKVISAELGQKLASMARFRNLLAHMYAKVDPKRVFLILHESSPDLIDFHKAIQAYVS